MILEAGCTLHDMIHEYVPIVHVSAVDDPLQSVAQLIARKSTPNENEALAIARGKAAQLHTNLPALVRAILRDEVTYQGWDILKAPGLK